MYIFKVYKYSCFYLFYAYVNPLIDVRLLYGSFRNFAFAGESG